MNIDIRILELINTVNKDSKTLDYIMIFFTKLGNNGFLWILLTAIMIINKKTRKIGFLLGISLFFTALLGEGILKNIIRRERPFYRFEDLVLLIKKPFGFSMPSGHAASSFAFATIFMIKKLRLRYLVLSIAILIAFSRVYLNVHYFTDIITGALLGIFISYVVVAFFSKKDCRI